MDKKSGNIVSFREAWTQATGQAIESGLDEQSAVYVLRAFDAPSSLMKLTDSIGKIDPGERRPLFEKVEKFAADSDYSTTEWLRGLERMLQFLIKQNRSSPIDVLLGYLSCSAEYLSASNGLLTFADGVDAFLEEFGFEG